MLLYIIGMFVGLGLILADPDNDELLWWQWPLGMVAWPILLGLIIGRIFINGEEK